MNKEKWIFVSGLFAGMLFLIIIGRPEETKQAINTIIRIIQHIK